MTICLEKKLFIRFTACVFHERLSISVCVSGGGGGRGMGSGYIRS